MAKLFGTGRGRMDAKKMTLLLALGFALVLGLLYVARPVPAGLGIAKRSGHTQKLNNDKTLVQPFTLKETAVNIGFTMGTFKKEIKTGSLTVEISDASTGETKARQVYDTAELKDNKNLKIETALAPGKYLMSFDFEGLPKRRSIILYTSNANREHCFIDGVEQNCEVFLTVRCQPNPESIRRNYLVITGGILLAMGIALAFSIRRQLRANPANRRKIILRNMLAFACLVAVAALLYIAFDEMMASGVASYMRNNREQFYLIVALLAVFMYLLSGDSPWYCWLLVGMIGLVWIYTDLAYNIIDEGAHTEIIQYILNNRWHFPLVSQNYEAVQGPLYYYVAALLTGWLPESEIYLGARVFGLFLTFLFGWITRKTLDELKRAEWYRGSDTLMNLLWLLFVINPNMLIRFTRVSNEALMCVLSAVVVLLVTQLFLHGFEARKLWLATICSALAFLTKSTSVVLVVLIFMVCAYYKKWKALFLQGALYLVIVAPWFINNYRHYGALTGMKDHVDFVLPIVNPDRAMPDVREDILHYFGSYFLNAECGVWYDYRFFDDCLSPLRLLMLVIATVGGVRHLCLCLRGGLRFSYATDEKRETVFLAFVLLPVLSLVMHTVQSVMTLNDTLKVSRYFFMMNGVFCSMLLMALAPVSERNKRILAGIIAAFYAFLVMAMIGGYTEIVTNTLLNP